MANSEDVNLAFSFDDEDFMAFLPIVPEVQMRSRWADFNIHDPGVTTYEAIQFSLEDFMYKYGFPIVDLLQGPKINAFDYWGLRDLLTTYAVTENDYRRLLAVFPDVLNVAVKPTLKANIAPNTPELICLLNVDVASYFPDLPSSVSEWENNLIEYRAVGEYFNRQEGCDTFIKNNWILVDIELKLEFVDRGKVTTADFDELRAALKKYLLPELEPIDYRRLSESGMLSSEVHTGPALNDNLQNLVINTSLLEKECYRKFILVSELYDVIEKMKFIKSIESIGVKRREDTMYKYDVLDLGEYTFTKLGELIVNGEMTLVPLIPINRKPNNTPNFINKRTVQGSYRNLGEFYSLQGSFPPNYEMGKYIQNQSDVNKDITASFRAFLYLMDQVRADLGAQMGNFCDVFSIQNTPVSVQEKVISYEPIYANITIPNASETEPRINDDRTFKERRVNYLLALNGWGVESSEGVCRATDEWLKIKNEFLILVNKGLDRDDLINTGLNKLFRSVSLITLQEMLRITLQRYVSHVRILEHQFLQPVWEQERHLNFELTVFLFPWDASGWDEHKSVIEPIVKALAPAHVIAQVCWKNTESVEYLDGLLKTAYPPDEVFYFDNEITAKQRVAMNFLMNDWIDINNS